LVERHPEVSSLHLLHFRSPFSREQDELRSLIKSQWPRATFRTQSVKKEYQDVIAVSEAGEFSLPESCRRCRALLLSKAGRYMERVGAEYLVVGDTGNRHGLSGQDTLAIARALGLEDRVLVPLLMEDPLFVPEKLSAWSLATQHRHGGLRGLESATLAVLVRTLGMRGADPMGSESRCRLTTPGFGDRVASLFAGHAVTLNALCLLDFPMYMTAHPDLQIVLAFEEQEKRDLQNYFLPQDLRLYPATPHGPMMLLRTDWQAKSLSERKGIVELAARLTATHARSNGEGLIPIYCRLECEEERQLINVQPFVSVEVAYEACGLERVPLTVPVQERMIA
jgi:hypothetical protein